MSQDLKTSAELLQRLTDTAKRYDECLSDPRWMGVSNLYKLNADGKPASENEPLLKRNRTEPAYVSMGALWERDATSQKWYLTPDELNMRSPARFTALDGTVIKKGPNGYKNPCPTGFSGPGVLGFGKDEHGNPIPESRAIDLVIQFMDGDALKFLGGVRGDTGQPCFIGGFTEEKALDTVVREFIEEAVSGSIIPQFPRPLAQACYHVLELRRLKEYEPDKLADEERQALAEFGIDAKKFSGDLGEAAYHVVQRRDPALIQELTDFFHTQLGIAYQGQNRSDPRNTDDRWIATTLFTALIQQDDVQKILHAAHRTLKDLNFAAGSDMRSIEFHAFGPDFVANEDPLKNSFASHGPLACYATAYNLQNQLARGIPIADSVATQIEKTIEAMNARILNHMNQDLGIQKAIFAVITPEINRVMSDTLPVTTDKHEDWMKVEGHIHDAFFKQWFQWTSPVLSLNSKAFPFQRPTAGASEGIRAAIEHYGATARRDRFEPEVHTFTGEYEGFPSYARAAYIDTKAHNRSHWHIAIEELKKASKDKPVLFCLSHPSAIDGSVWPDYDDFMKTLARECPNVKVLLDLTYVGLVAKDYHVNADYPNVQHVVFSLSKPAGSYYNRIGGFISREEFPPLYGHKWFLNMDSLKVGTEFMRKFGIRELPQKYAKQDQIAVAQIWQRAKDAVVQGEGDYRLPKLRPSDVWGIAVGEPSSDASMLERSLTRGTGDYRTVRVCTTPTLSYLIASELAPESLEAVKAFESKIQARAARSAQR